MSFSNSKPVIWPKCCREIGRNKSTGWIGGVNTRLGQCAIDPGGAGGGNIKVCQPKTWEWKSKVWVEFNLASDQLRCRLFTVQLYSRLKTNKTTRQIGLSSANAAINCSKSQCLGGLCGCMFAQWSYMLQELEINAGILNCNISWATDCYKSTEAHISNVFGLS